MILRFERDASNIIFVKNISSFCWTYKLDIAEGDDDYLMEGQLKVLVWD